MARLERDILKLDVHLVGWTGAGGVLAATNSLDTKFDGTNGKLQHYFLDAIHDRANTYGLLSVLRIDVGVAPVNERDVLYLMQLVKDLRDCTGIKIGKTPPKVHCRIFEDNSGALEMVRLAKMRLIFVSMLPVADSNLSMSSTSFWGRSVRNTTNNSRIPVFVGAPACRSADLCTTACPGPRGRRMAFL